jgi:alpha-galactosidase
MSLILPATRRDLHALAMAICIGLFAVGSFYSSAHGQSPSPVAAEILTPKPPETPRINGPKIFGVRPGSAFLYAIPATGERPMTFAVDGLPGGLKLDPASGRITGVLNTAGEIKVTLRARNSLGAAGKPFRIIVGEDIALTPAMGWNSYNSFGAGITQDIELREAKAMVASGLAQHGWTYVNMDDGWIGKERGGPYHALQPDPERYTGIKGMVDQIHAMGLKAGLYSTPWTITYAGRLGGSSENPDGAWPADADFKAKKNARVLPFAIGKYSFATNDARQFAAWGFDYLKLDWGPVEAPETKEMYQALRATGRDIVLSLSNNHVKNLFAGIGEVSKWAESWRTTTDINDNWKRVAFDIGFAQDAWAPFARPGHFNDADMLVVGDVGWFGKLRPSRLTPDEQYTHITLWCLLSSPLLIGCDLEKLDDFTLGLLTNDEVLEIDQDSLGKQATQVGGQGDQKIYAKPLDDGSLAVGLFNTGATASTVTANWADLKLTGKQRVRDLWRQKDLGVFAGKFDATVAPHGVVLVRLFPNPS